MALDCFSTRLCSCGHFKSILSCNRGNGRRPKILRQPAKLHYISHALHIVDFQSLFRTLYNGFNVLNTRFRHLLAQSYVILFLWNAKITLETVFIGFLNFHQIGLRNSSSFFLLIPIFQFLQFLTMFPCSDPFES